MRTCVFDLETTELYADRAILLCAVLQDFGGSRKEQKVFRADSYPEWKKDRTQCRGIVNDVLNALAGVGDEDEFDIFVAHNGQYFDKRMLTSWALQYDIRTKIRFQKFIDPVMLCRKHMRLKRNSLENVIEFLNVPHKKTPVEWAKWMQVIFNGSRDCLDYIVEHCQADVTSLDHVYRRVKCLVKGIDERGSAG